MSKIKQSEKNNAITAEPSGKPKVGDKYTISGYGLTASGKVTPNCKPGREIVFTVNRGDIFKFRK